MKKKVEGRRAHERPPRATGDGGRGKGSGAGDKMPGERKKNTGGKEQDGRKRRRWGGNGAAEIGQGSECET